LASIFYLSISMHLLLTFLHTFLLFSSPITQISPSLFPSNSWSFLRVFCIYHIGLDVIHLYFFRSVSRCI
jgi:hypothetical protein